ncbi:MAG TPA: RDD family protein, partial [Thermoanaerobaculia bacterium]|nr:RDD family protein [Thermoanaerobaculia bacterium]
VKLGVVGPSKAGEEPADGVVEGHGTSSYGSGSRPGEPAGTGQLPASRLWIRAAAFGADLLLLAGAPLLVSTFVIVLVLLSTPDPPPTLARGFHAAQALFALLFLLRDTGGKSPGKRLFGLVLHREGGGRVTALDSLARNLPMLVPGWNLIELLVVIRRPDGRRQGDRLAGTTLLEA